MLREECRLRTLENGALRKIFKPKREVTGGWITLHNEFHDLYVSSCITRVINSKRVRCVEHVEHALKKRNLQE
jgi:hypothetical protein